MSTSPTSFDPATFWELHDHELDTHGDPSEITLSHDLYRGMPAWFNAYFAHFQRRSVMRLLHRCDYQSGQRLLDLGCGTGRWSGLFAHMGLRAFGVDMGRQAVQMAAVQWSNAAFSCGRLPNLAFADESFEHAISVTVLQHIPREYQLEAVREVWRVLKPHGYLIICESGDDQDSASHVFGNKVARWLDLFQAAGFKVVTQSACEYLPYVKVFHWLRRRFPGVAQGKRVQEDVSQVARLLRQHRFLAFGIRLFIALSYPIEYLASWLLSPKWARLGCFLLSKS